MRHIRDTDLLNAVNYIRHYKYIRDTDIMHNAVNYRRA